MHHHHQNGHHGGHHDGHHHGHDHEGHDHSHVPQVNAANVRAIGLAAILTGGFMLAEVAGGIISGSLALIADAGHMLTDFAALALAWIAFRLARRPGDWKRSYGFERFSVLAAFVNGLALFLIAGWIVIEAAFRIADPVPVLGGPMLVVAIGGLAVNLLVLAIMRRADPNNLNVRAAMLHVIGDLLGSVAAIAAAGIILVTGWSPIDPLLSVLVALIILRSAWAITGQAGHILLEGAPEGLEPETIRDDLARNVPGIAEIHHVHSWSISAERPVVTLHARLENGTGADTARQAIKARLAERFHIDHATVEIELPGESCTDG
ncbi:MAG: cation diffusion facilitator family transporter [Blastomonas sp.]